MWRGVNNKIIILDLLKLMDQNGLSLDQLHQRWFQSTERSELEKHLTDEIFGEHSGSKSWTKSRSKGSSDFDFYRQLFVKIFDIFRQRRVKTTESTTAKKRSRLEQDYEMMPSKRRRATTTSSGASTISEDSQLSLEDSCSLEQSLVQLES